LQAPEIEDVKVADVSVHAVDDGAAKAQCRYPDTLLKYDRAPKCEGVTVVILDRLGGDLGERVVKFLVGERDVG